MGLVNRLIVPQLKRLAAKGRLKTQGPNRIQASDLFDIRRGGMVVLGRDTTFRERVVFRVDKDAKVSLGNGVFVNDGCEFNCHQNILIEDDVMFGQNVLMFDHDHDYRKGPKGKRTEFVASPITVKANAWIGANVVILKGVTIGMNSIVAAGSVVVKDVPDNCIFYNARESRNIDISEFNHEIH